MQSPIQGRLFLFRLYPEKWPYLPQLPACWENNIPRRRMTAQTKQPNIPEGPVMEFPNNTDAE